MSDHPDRSSPHEAETPPDNDLNDEPEVDVNEGAPQSNPDSTGGVRTGEEKAAHNREVDPPG